MTKQLKPLDASQLTEERFVQGQVKEPAAPIDAHELEPVEVRDERRSPRRHALFVEPLVSPDDPENDDEDWAD